MWWGTRENQDMRRRQELLLWGSVGECLKTTHISPLTEHPAPTHTLLLSPELQLGHTRSPHTPRCHALSLLPKALGSGAALGPHELGVLHTQPSLPAQGAA